MADEPDYQKTVALVESIDASRVPESASVDIGEAFEDRLQIKRLRYAEVSEPLDKLETRRPTPEEAQQRQPQQPRIRAQPKPQTQVKRPQVQPQSQPQPQVSVPKRSVSKEMVGAAARLRSIAGGAEKEFAEGVTRKMEEAQEVRLVMPRLSLQDQLSDLDKMKEGLDEKVFDREQLKIIAQEMKGMSQIAAREDTSRMSLGQRELVLMRNQRVKEITSRLNAG